MAHQHKKPTACGWLFMLLFHTDSEPLMFRKAKHNRVRATTQCYYRTALCASFGFRVPDGPQPRRFAARLFWLVGHLNYIDSDPRVIAFINNIQEYKLHPRSHRSSRYRPMILSHRIMRELRVQSPIKIIHPNFIWNIHYLISANRLQLTFVHKYPIRLRRFHM